MNHIDFSSRLKDCVECLILASWITLEKIFPFSSASIDPSIIEWETRFFKLFPKQTMKLSMDIWVKYRPNLLLFSPKKFRDRVVLVALESQKINEQTRVLNILVNSNSPRQPNRILTQVPPRIRRIIPKPIVIQPRLLILVLPRKAKRYQRTISLQATNFSVNVQFALPHSATFRVVGLVGGAEVVTDDAVPLVADQFRRRRKVPFSNTHVTKSLRATDSNFPSGRLCN